MRIYDIDCILEGNYYTVYLARPPFGKLPNFIQQIADIEEWLDNHCNGEYIILAKSVLLKREDDALLFKLKYG